MYSNVTITLQCLPFEDKITSIMPQVRYALTSIYAGNLLVEFPINVLVIYMILSTKQQGNQSTRLILYGSIIDSFGSLLYNSIYIVYMRNYEHLSCTILFVLNALASLSMLGTAGISLFIAFDRYIRIRYLNDYTLVFTRKRHYLALAVAMSIVFIQVKQ